MLLKPSNSLTLTHNGKTQTLHTWAKEVGIPYDVLRMRHVRGWDKDTLFSPVGHRRPNTSPTNKKAPKDVLEVIEHDGYAFTLKQWAEFLEGAIPYDTLRMRYRRGLRGDELFKQVQTRTPK